MNILSEEKVRMLSSDMIIEKSVELYGFTPKEKSDENMKWMREHGYQIKQVQTRRRGRYWTRKRE